MERILQEIEHAIKVRLYYLALAMSLTLPDLCAALEAPDGKTSPARYKNWYNAHLAAKFSRLTDVDCYSLRCGVVHQGRFGHPKMRYGRVIFTLPARQTFTDCITDDAYFTGAEQFCLTMVASVRAWFAVAQNDPAVQGNLPRLVEVRPQGLAPYVVGLPVIA